MFQQLPKLEVYLTRIDSALKSISLSQRADIISEIKKQILKTLEKQPVESLEQVLTALGEPEHVANRYLIELDRAPVKVPTQHSFRWIAFSLFGCFALFLLTILIVIFNFTPLVAIDKEAGQVSILGDLIQVQERHFTTKNSKSTATSNMDVSGSSALNAETKPELKIPFSNARLALETSKDRNINWDCRIENKDKITKPLLSESSKGYEFDISALESADCKIQLPKDTKVYLNGSNGTVFFREPDFHVDLKLQNGQVSIDPDQALNYAYEFDVKNGSVSPQLVSENVKNAKAFRVSIQNGVVRTQSNL